MNAQPLPASESPEISLASGAVDAQNPWVGLASFTEETRAFFYGRDEEVGELARRVQRKLLTVLFGQSGLGKTSILRAGLVPRLRGHGYCPVYVRIDYGRDSPEPADQIKQAIARTAREVGQWTQAGVAIEGESLWEFLHHRDDVLRDEHGATVVPLLIFDQFEEIFTLAQSDEFGRARAARFIEELADLVENRPPKAFEARLDADDSAAEQFDFARSDYRVLIALREDYLAPLESLKGRMPSIAQNRLRLAPMTGAQAMQAVLQPGKSLVSEEVAAAIVRFVAGGAELTHAEVEPSLLSLICRELNDTRIAQGRSEISLDLLAGSHETILSNFYERTLSDQPAEVRRLIEDELLTESGFRENVAEETLLRRFVAAGASPDALRKLVNRRLLRIEERLDKRRVELTHDVLCGVVRGSRDRRHEREAREAAERQLVEQRNKELAARKALMRARKIAAVCIVLALGALVAAGFAYFNSQRALRAERAAQQTRVASEQARNQAERLIGYLTDDFARELESVGRLNTLAEFTQRQIDYFHALPPQLKGRESTLNGSLALIHHARTLRRLGQLKVAHENTTEAISLLTPFRERGDTSEQTTVALALAHAIEAGVLDNQNDPGATKALQQAVDLITPLAERPNPSIGVQRGYVQVLQQTGFEDQASGQNEAAVVALKKCMTIAGDLGGRDFSDIDMAAMYAECAAWLVVAQSNLGRNADARRVGLDGAAVARKVLQLRPGYRLALHASQVIYGGLNSVAQGELNPAEALKFGQDDIEVSTQAFELDPNNTVAANNLSVAYSSSADAAWASGNLRKALEFSQKALGSQSRAALNGGVTFILIRMYDATLLAYRQAQIGDDAASAATLAENGRFVDRMRVMAAPNGFEVGLSSLISDTGTVIRQLYRGDAPQASEQGHQVIERLEKLKADGRFQERQKALVMTFASDMAARADLQIGDLTAAERNERKALAARRATGEDSVQDKRDIAEISSWLATALARAGRTADSLKISQPVVAQYRELSGRNHGDRWLSLHLATALYVESLADPARATALRAESARLMDSLPAEMRNAREIQLWRERMRAVQ